jgi:hypothetical protein
MRVRTLCYGKDSSVGGGIFPKAYRAGQGRAGRTPLTDSCVPQRSVSWPRISPVGFAVVWTLT